MEKLPLSNILFLDIETVPQHPAYEALQDDWKKLWDQNQFIIKIQ
ncbi:MAG: hypothetical protein R2796_12155 [Chitinophagaceae bacterium]